MSAWEIFVDKLIAGNGYKLVLTGLLNTAIIAVFGLIIGFLIGSVCAVVKSIPTYTSKLPVVFQKIVDIYVTIFRGTPMVVQLLIMHFILMPTLGIRVPSIIFSQNFVIDGVVIEAIMAFALNSGAYMSEIMRGGIDSVDKGQLEAGRALGLSYPSAMISIVVPQAFKNVLPTLGNEFIALIKETSVCSFIAVNDLTKSFQNIAASTYEYIVPYIVLAVVYLVIVLIITYIVHLVERRLHKNDRNNQFA